MAMDEVIAGMTRQIGHIRGVTRLVEPLRHYYARHYRLAKDPNVIVHQLDGTLSFQLDRRAQMSNLIYWYGVQGISELMVLKRRARPTDVFIDVGANIGVFTLLMAQQVPQGKVIAFEPSPVNYASIVENTKLNQLDNVIALNCGLSDTPGELPLYVADEEQTQTNCNATLLKGGVFTHLAGMVELRVLDEVLPTLNIERVDLMKIDTEGAELQVLRGARQTLEQYRPSIVIEINQMFNDAGYDVEEVIAFLQSLHYTPLLIKRNGQVQPVAWEQVAGMHFCNLLCEPQA